MPRFPFQLMWLAHRPAAEECLDRQRRSAGLNIVQYHSEVSSVGSKRVHWSCRAFVIRVHFYSRVGVLGGGGSVVRGAIVWSTPVVQELPRPCCRSPPTNWKSPLARCVRCSRTLLASLRPVHHEPRGSSKFCYVADCGSGAPEFASAIVQSSSSDPLAVLC
jgi:hypothetical protein